MVYIIRVGFYASKLASTGERYIVNTVVRQGIEEMIANYVKNQGKESEYKRLYKQVPLVSGR